MGSKAALVIDDSGPVRTAVANILRACGFDVFEAANSEEALTIVAAEDICLAISDMYLDEKMSGAALLEQAVKVRPGLKGVLMSGSIVPGEKVRTPFPLLSKPFNPQHLIDLAARLLAETD